MLKAITIIKRKQGISVEEFQDYWLHKHVDVIRKLPGIQRYIQNHPLPENYIDGVPVCDGVAELWANDSQAFKDMGTSNAYNSVLADEEAFIDRSKLNLIMTSESIIKDGPTSSDGIKYIEFFQHDPELEIKEFQRYWREVHGPLVCNLPLLKRYVQSPSRLGGYTANRSPTYDGLSSMWFDSTDDLDESLNSENYSCIREDESNFIIPGNIPNLIFKEFIIVN